MNKILLKTVSKIFDRNMTMRSFKCINISSTLSRHYSTIVQPPNEDKNSKFDEKFDESRNFNLNEKTTQSLPNSHEWRASNVAANLYEEIKTIKYQGWSVVIIVLAIIGGCVYLVYNNRKEIVHYFGRQGATAAQVTITDPQVVQNVELLSKQVVHDILNDEKTMQVVLKFVVDLLARTDVKTSTQILTLWVLNTPEVLQTTQIISTKVYHSIYYILILASKSINVRSLYYKFSC